MKAIHVILGSILAGALLSFAQDDDDDESPVGAVITKEGVMAFSNWENDYFTFELKGKNPQVSKKFGTFLVNLNGKGIQFNVVNVSDFLTPEEIKKCDDSAVLWKHMKFERSYFEENLKTSLAVKAENKKCGNGRPILVWSFKMPEKKDGNVKKQLIVSTVTKNHVLTCNGILLKEKDYKDFYNVLADGMNSLRLEKNPINPEALEGINSA